MINKFYSIDTGIDEVNCFSVSELYYRMAVARVPYDTIKNFMPYVQSMKPNDYFVICGEKFGRVEVRCWSYEKD